jgi:para-aminobenzoate synthetase
MTQLTDSEEIKNHVLTSACLEIQSAIGQLKSNLGKPIVVALDGGSGAGKSVLASMLNSNPDSVVIPVDDFFAADIPENRWATFSVEEKLERVFDWSRLRKRVIKPLLAGKPARWYAFDFEAGLRSDGTYGMKDEVTEVTSAAVILLDGVYTAGPYLRDLIDLRILVDVPTVERHRRLAMREDADFLRRWHAIWDELERYYFNEVSPNASYDVVVGNDRVAIE